MRYEVIFMKKDFFLKLKEKRDETREIPLQDFGKYSILYREIASYFKISPLRPISFFAILGTVLLLYFLGSSFVRLASILGGGF